MQLTATRMQLEASAQYPRPRPSNDAHGRDGRISRHSRIIPPDPQLSGPQLINRDDWTPTTGLPRACDTSDSEEVETSPRLLQHPRALVCPVPSEVRDRWRVVEPVSSYFRPIARRRTPIDPHSIQFRSRPSRSFPHYRSVHHSFRSPPSPPQGLCPSTVRFLVDGRCRSARYGSSRYDSRDPVRKTRIRHSRAGNHGSDSGAWIASQLRNRRTFDSNASHGRLCSSRPDRRYQVYDRGGHRRCRRCEDVTSQELAR